MCRSTCSSDCRNVDGCEFVSTHTTGFGSQDGSQTGAPAPALSGFGSLREVGRVAGDKHLGPQHLGRHLTHPTFQHTVCHMNLGRAARTLVGVIVATTALVAVEPSASAAGPWTDTTGCTRVMNIGLVQSNPNMSQAVIVATIGDPQPPCWSVAVQVNANLFGTVVSASSNCYLNWVNAYVYSPNAYGNPWWVRGSVGYSGSGGDCGASTVHFA